MAGVVPDEGEAHMLAIVLGIVAVEALELRLYVNDHTPGPTDTALAYTEMSGHGYSAHVLDGDAWDIDPATAGPGTPALADAGDITFVFDASGTPTLVYGAYLVGASSGVLWGAQRFASPVLVESMGDQIVVPTTWRLRSE